MSDVITDFMSGDYPASDRPSGRLSEDIDIEWIGVTRADIAELIAKTTADVVMGGQRYAVVWGLREAAKDWRRNGLSWGDPDEETNTDLLVARKLDERADRIERGEHP